MSIFSKKEKISVRPTLRESKLSPRNENFLQEYQVNKLVNGYGQIVLKYQIPRGSINRHQVTRDDELSSLQHCLLGHAPGLQKENTTVRAQRVPQLCCNRPPASRNRTPVSFELHPPSHSDSLLRCYGSCDNDLLEIYQRPRILHGLPAHTLDRAHFSHSRHAFDCSAAC